MNQPLDFVFGFLPGSPIDEVYSKSFHIGTDSGDRLQMFTWWTIRTAYGPTTDSI